MEFAALFIPDSAVDCILLKSLVAGSTYFQWWTKKTEVTIQLQRYSGVGPVIAIGEGGKTAR